MELNTTYLGILLPHPLMVGSGPLGDDIDVVKELEDAGAAAIVLRSLYEEEIKGEQIAAFLHSESHGDSSAEAGSYFPDPESALGPEEYLEHLRRVKRYGRYPGSRLAQWEHARGVALLCSASGTSWSRRAGIEHLPCG